MSDRSIFNKLSAGVGSGVKAGGQFAADVIHGDFSGAADNAKNQLKAQDNIWTNGYFQKMLDPNKLTPAATKVPTIPQPTAPAPIVAPKMPSDMTVSNVTGAPQSFQGAKIAAPTMNLSGAQINTPGNMADYQNQAAAALAARASGQGPSIADMQAQQARQQGQAQIMAQLASARGGANPLAARTAMNATTTQNAQINRDAMMAKIAEQQNAQSLLGQVAGQGRGQDIQQATSQAQLNQEADLTKYKGQLDQAVAQGQLDQRTAESMFTEANQNARVNAQMGQAFNESRAKYAAMGLDADKANQMAAMDIERMRQSGALGQADLTMKGNAAKQQAQSGLLSGAAGVLGTVAGAYFGGPAGAAAGSQLGQKLASQASAPQDQGGSVNENGVYQNADSEMVNTADQSNPVGTGGQERNYERGGQ